MPATALTARLRNGVRIEYAEQGDRHGVPVLLLHGVTDSWCSFGRVLPHLPASLHVIAPSLRGHGDSDRPAHGYGPADMAHDVALLMDELGIAQAVVMGHSMGSTVALRLALDHPQRVLGLVLVGAVTTWRGNSIFDELAEQASRLTDPVDARFVRTFQESTLARPVPASFLGTVVHESRKVPARVWREAFGALAGADFARELPRIAVPTLITWGDQDVMTAGEQSALHASLRGSRMVVYDGAGHAPHWEEPSRFARDLAAFVSRDVAARSSCA